MFKCGLFRSNFVFTLITKPYTLSILWNDQEVSLRILLQNTAGAGDGNRTHIASLEGWSFTTKLHPHGGRGRIRTYVDVRRQIYSLLPLTTRPPFQLYYYNKQLFYKVNEFLLFKIYPLCFWGINLKNDAHNSLSKFFKNYFFLHSYCSFFGHFTKITL